MQLKVKNISLLLLKNKRQKNGSTNLFPVDCSLFTIIEYTDQALKQNMNINSNINQHNSTISGPDDGTIGTVVK